MCFERWILGSRISEKAIGLTRKPDHANQSVDELETLTRTRWSMRTSANGSKFGEGLSEGKERILDVEDISSRSSASSMLNSNLNIRSCKRSGPDAE